MLDKYPEWFNSRYLGLVKNRTIYIIILLFITLALTMFYYIFSTEHHQQSIPDNDLCKPLSELECLKNERCYPSYKEEGPHTDKVGSPVLNVTFAECNSLTNDEFILLREAKEKCTPDKGSWITTIGNPKGFCSVSSSSK